MRVLIWHGWHLSGSGSNVYTARVAERLRAAGHDVVLMCQEPRPERAGFVDQAGPVTEAGPAAGLEHGPGRCVVLRPEIGTLLPVFVVDEYEGFEVKRFVDLTDEELDRYLGVNVDALQAAAAWHRSEAVIAGHAVPGAVVARRALGPGRYLAKVHGSDLEYAVRIQSRYAAMAKEALEDAIAVAGGSKDVLDRALEFAPAADRLEVIPPGVDVEAFRPRPRREALLEVSRLLAADRASLTGRPSSLAEDLGAAVRRRDADAIRQLAGSYDQTSPDVEARFTLHDIAVNDFDHYPADEGGGLVGFFGKLIAQKGPELFQSALHLLSRRTVGLVVGFGSAREWLEALEWALREGDVATVRWLAEAAPMRVDLTDEEIRLGASGNVSRFTGRLDHRYAPFVLAALDVLVVPSVLDEAFGMVAAEGAACGCLPLVARHSGLAEVARALEAEVGRPELFSFEPGPGAAHRIAEGIQRLLALPAPDRADLRRAVSDFVARDWTWDRTAARLLEAATLRPAEGFPASVRPAGSR